MRLPAIAGLTLVGVLSLATPSYAQRERSSWGAVVHYTPEWNVAKGLFEDTWENGRPNKLTGSEFQIGIARGRMLGGDWGASLVRRKVTPGSTIGGVCFQPFGCDDVSGVKHTFNDDVTLTGLQLHKFVPFVTIARRVQVGLNAAAGFGVYRGTATREEAVFATTQPPVAGVQATPGVDVRTLFMVDTAPIGKLELAVAGIVARGIKARVGVGLDFPGYPVVSVTGVYLFGADY